MLNCFPAISVEQLLLHHAAHGGYKEMRAPNRSLINSSVSSPLIFLSLQWQEPEHGNEHTRRRVLDRRLPLRPYRRRPPAADGENRARHS